MVFYVGRASVAAGGILLFIRAAVFMCILSRVISPRAHFMSSFTEGVPFLLKVTSGGAFSDVLARLLISIRALMSRRSSNS